MPARRISFVNFKGGVGKTSLVINIAACLAYDLNQKVLVVDCDAQSNLSIWLMGLGRFMAAYDAEASVYGILTGKAPFLQKAIHKSVVQANGHVFIKDLDLLPAVYELMDVENEFDPKGGMLPVYGRFYETLSAVFHDYNYILFDCPPNVYRSTKAALFTSREIYVPCNPDPLSNMGLSLLRQKLTAFHNEVAPLRREITSHKFTKIRGAILNNVPRGNIEEMIEKIRLKIRSLREYRNIACEDADILPMRIRHAVAASRTIDRELPFVLSSENPELKQDYINLARYIHESPLS
jgi:chromosome partitioning protein